MKPRSTHLLLAFVALASIAVGTGVLYILSGGGRDAGGRNKAQAPAAHPAGGPLLAGLRRAVAPQEPAPKAEAPAPAPAPAESAAPVEPPALAHEGPPEAAAAPQPPAPPETQTTTGEQQTAGVEGAVSLPPVAPRPPARPAELQTAETGAPLPPPRPNDLAALQPPPEQAGAPARPPIAQPQAAAPQQLPASPWSFWSPAAPQPAPEAQQTAASPAPNLVDAPLPPTRPAELAAVAPDKTAASSAGGAQPAAPQQQTARLEEPALRPAPDDAFQAPPPKFGMGDPVFVRIFKQEGQLELWLMKNGRYSLYKTFPICKWSGRLGPKVKEADYQSPEGFYSVSAKQLNPRSNYYRAFNVGYPNAFDRQNGRTGGLVMVHGACKSVGCFAMTDRGIEEIYGFVEAALRAGQKEFPVHIFPFRMTEANITRETGGGGGWLSFVGGGGGYQQWVGFWRNLKEGYDIFEKSGQPPVAFACGDHYEFDNGSASCRRVAGW
ncbi:MAG TPA: L,D-transpeptidase family protein [Methylocystis sp.]